MVPPLAGSNTAGDPANGVDGSALLAEGDAGTWASNCLTCHPTGTYSWTGIHTDTQGGVNQT